VGGDPADSSGSLDSIQLREPNVQQNQVWLQSFRLLNRLQPVRYFANDLQTRLFLKRRTDEAPPSLVVIYDENPNG